MHIFVQVPLNLNFVESYFLLFFLCSATIQILLSSYQILFNLPKDEI